MPIPVQRSFTKTRTFTPAEAYSISGEFRAASQAVRQLAGRLQAIGGTLDANWEGNAKHNFLGRFGSRPGATHSAADWLAAKAGEIETIQVSVSETVWETVWE